MPAARPFVVIDTVVYLQATISGSNVASSVLRRIGSGDATAYVSHELLHEIRDVLTRPEIRTKNARLSDDELNGFINAIRANSVLVDNLAPSFRLDRDPDDEHIISLAVTVRAEFIVTRDADLLDLMDETRADGRAFRTTYPGISIVEPGDFITRLNRLREPDA